MSERLSASPTRAGNGSFVSVTRLNPVLIEKLLS